MMKQETPRSNRFHIGIFGQTNSGKSSLLNVLVGQQVAIVSDVAGTTTDVVQKNMELPGVGPCVFLDTAGFDDHTQLGTLRLEQSRKAAMRVDLALLVVSAGKDDGWEEERQWKAWFDRLGIPVLGVLTQCDRYPYHQSQLLQTMNAVLGLEAIPVSSLVCSGLDRLRAAIASSLSASGELDDLTGSLVHEGDTVLLVMPQDIQAPKGRLILPQVQTIRNLLDKKCLVMSCTADSLPAMLSALTAPPALIITDSQAFAQVEPLCPPETRLTSFSVLFARHKGDIHRFVVGAAALRQLSPSAHILIAEACSHVPQNEDIGRVKLPRLLRKRFGEALQIDIVSGNDFPDDLTPYDLIIHCGACMFTRRHVLGRVARAVAQNVPVTNYGIALAELTGILDRVVYPD